MMPYVALFRVRFINSLQYRFGALAGLSTQLVWGFMLVLAFMAFYQSGADNFPITMSQTVTVIWMQQAFLMMFWLWSYDNSIFESIERGDIAYDLVRPMDLYARWFTTSTASRVSAVMLRCWPVLIIGFLLPGDFRITPPSSLFQFLAFVLSMFLALGVVVSIAMLVYISAFYTINSLGTRTIAGFAGEFLSGAIIPLPFFPDFIRPVVSLLPFASIQNAPLMIFAGVYTGGDIYRSIGLQVFWIVVLNVIGKYLFSHAIKRVISQGG